MDVKTANGNDTDTTMSGVYVDMDSMNLTASNTGRYLVFANLQITQTSSAAAVYVIINLNGVDQIVTERTIQLETGNPNVIPLVDFFSSISNGDIIKIRWRIIGPGDVSVNNRRLIIQQV